MSASLAANRGSLRQLEGAHAVRLQPVRRPDALHRAQARCRPPWPSPGRSSGSPRPAARRGQLDHPLDRLGRQRRLAGLAGLVAQQPVDALAHEALLPAPDHRLRHARAAHDLGGAAALGRRQDDPCARRHASAGVLRSPTIRSSRTRSAGVTSTTDPCSHPQSMTTVDALGNPPNASLPLVDRL